MQSVAFARRNAAVRIAVAVVALWLGAAPAAAEPIEFRFSGLGTGTAGGRGFTNAAFTITALADTAGIVTVDSGASTVYSVAAPAVIEISGIGSGRITTPTRVFQNDTASGMPAAGLSRLPHDTGSDLLDVYDPALLGYRLDTSIGPIVEPAPVIVGFFNAVGSELGTLNFSVQSFTFQATLVPEPAGLLVLSCAALALRRRRP